MMNRITLYLMHLSSLVLVTNLMACSPEPAEELRTVAFLDLESRLPAAWVEEQPSSSMRLAQYRIPANDTAGDASLVLYFFGQGQGGTAQANIARWQSQFTKPGGGSVEPRVETLQVGRIPVTVAEFRGDYARGAGMGPVGAAEPDQILLASIVESPGGSVYIQLYGPAASVSNQRAAYMQFIRSIRHQPAGQ